MDESHKHAASDDHDHGDHHAHMVADYKKRFWVSAALTIPVLILSPMVRALFGIGDALLFDGDVYVLFVLSTFIYFYGGRPFLSGLFRELKSRKPGMMTLIAIAISTAYLYSAAVVFGLDGKYFFWELATLIDVMLVGHWIEMRSVMGASRALEELARLMPSVAHVVDEDGTINDIPTSELKQGDHILIKPGEKVAADGEVLEGDSSVNESMLTGESVPVSKAVGAKVIGGSINGEGSLTARVENTGEGSFLSQVIELVRKAQESKSQTQDLANRAAVWLTIVALGGGALTMLYWFGIAGREFSFALERTVTVMVIACPHALGLAVPLVVAVSTSIGARNGLLIRDRTAFEAARNLDAVVFDKTGTLTEGKFGVTDILRFDESVGEKDLVRLAAAVEQHSEHPIARGIVASASEIPAVEHFLSIPGKGARGTVSGKQIAVVSPGYLKEAQIDVTDERVVTLASEGKTVVFVLIDDSLAGAIALADVIREESKPAIEALHQMGIQTLMLTGDNRQVAAWVTGQIHLDEFIAEVLPEEKAARIIEIQARGLKVAMTGDGVNDAPALAQADVGIAIGAGTDVAVEAADIVLIRSDPADVIAILKLSRATYKKMIQNLWWAAGYNIVAIPLAAGVLINAGILVSPAIGAALMTVSTVVVAINARMLKIDN
jgi:Cu2+-exporting ATPase